ncbi:hypothetical protein B0H19DRAFT_1265485 [Mycena capillaripes]|nr:hypothetical protein B0H19DRAFT_1265485 [Mycena capillaripes]
MVNVPTGRCNESVYGPNTDEFILECWPTKDGSINTVLRDPSTTFGFGRRICPGRDMAQWFIWICAASMLATLDISKILNEKGVPIEPSGKYLWGIELGIG